MKKKLVGVLLASALSIGVLGCYVAKKDTPKQEVAITHYEYVSGKIISKDEDSLAIATYNGSTNFELEHLKIISRDGKTYNRVGKTYKLILPGPSSYEAGDEVIFKYRPMSRISYYDLVSENVIRGNAYSLQTGYFDNIDGVIER